MKHFNIITALVILIASLSQSVLASGSSEEKTLFSPTPAPINAEIESHRIIIYDGMTDVQVPDILSFFRNSRCAKIHRLSLRRKGVLSRTYQPNAAFADRRTSLSKHPLRCGMSRYSLEGN